MLLRPVDPIGDGSLLGQVSLDSVWRVVIFCHLEWREMLKAGGRAEK
jgi:hypothetical protein